MTAMQELIDRSENALKMLPNKSRFDVGVKFATETFINTATELLEKEKEYAESLARERAVGFQKFVSSYENAIQARHFFGVETSDELYSIYHESIKQKGDSNE